MSCSGANHSREVIFSCSKDSVSLFDTARHEEWFIKVWYGLSCGILHRTVLEQELQHSSLLFGSRRLQSLIAGKKIRSLSVIRKWHV